jgi:hypothetical protein
MRRGVVIRSVINGITFDGATNDAMRWAIRDALIAFMAATAQARKRKLRRRPSEPASLMRGPMVTRGRPIGAASRATAASSSRARRRCSESLQASVKSPGSPGPALSLNEVGEACRMRAQRPYEPLSLTRVGRKIRACATSRSIEQEEKLTPIIESRGGFSAARAPMIPADLSGRA